MSETDAPGDALDVCNGVSSAVVSETGVRGEEPDACKEASPVLAIETDAAGDALSVRGGGICVRFAMPSARFGGDIGLVAPATMESSSREDMGAPGSD